MEIRYPENDRGVIECFISGSFQRENKSDTKCTGSYVFMPCWVDGTDKKMLWLEVGGETVKSAVLWQYNWLLNGGFWLISVAHAVCFQELPFCQAQNQI